MENKVVCYMNLVNYPRKWARLDLKEFQGNKGFGRQEEGKWDLLFETLNKASRDIPKIRLIKFIMIFLI